MMTRSRLALHGFTVVLATAGVGVAHAALAPGGAPATQAGSSPSHSAIVDGTCTLPAHPSSATPHNSPTTVRTHRHSSSAGNLHAAATVNTTGNVAVTIPRAVFIRLVGTALVVTTNTGEAPQPHDTFYSIANGHARLAGARLKRQVDSGCTAG
jgi:hypothetical protein